MTLTGKLAFEVQASLEEHGGYDRGDSMRRYLNRQRLLELIVLAIIVLVVISANVFEWW